MRIVFILRLVCCYFLKHSSDSHFASAGFFQVCGLKWSPDYQHLASGGNDNKLYIWNTHSTEPMLTYSDHIAAVKVILDKTDIFFASQELVVNMSMSISICKTEMLCHHRVEKSSVDVNILKSYQLAYDLSLVYIYTFFLLSWVSDFLAIKI